MMQMQYEHEPELERLQSYYEEGFKPISLDEINPGFRTIADGLMSQTNAKTNSGSEEDKDDLRSVVMYSFVDMGDKWPMFQNVDRIVDSFSCEASEEPHKSLIYRILSGLRKMDYTDASYLFRGVPFKKDVSRYQPGAESSWRSFVLATPSLEVALKDANTGTVFMLIGKFYGHDVSAVRVADEKSTVVLEPLLPYRVVYFESFGKNSPDLIVLEGLDYKRPMIDTIPSAFPVKEDKFIKFDIVENDALFQKYRERIQEFQGVPREADPFLNTTIVEGSEVELRLSEEGKRKKKPKRKHDKGGKIFPECEPFSNVESIFKETDWITEITGHPEEVVRANLGTFIEFKKEKKPFIPGLRFTHLQIKNYPDLEGKPLKNRVDCGTVAFCSLAQLFYQLNLLTKKKPLILKKECKFIFLMRGDEESIRFVDHATLQATKENAGSMFQCASHYNGLELAMDGNPETPGFVTNYATTPLQAPAASVSVGGGTITRCLATFYSEANKDRPEEWPSTAERQLNMLDDPDVSKYFTVRNGYIQQTGQEPPLPDRFTKERRENREYRDVLNKVKVVVQVNAEVTSGTKMGKRIERVEERHTVSQVFCSAMNIGPSELGQRNLNAPGGEDKAEFMLKAAYETTYAAAICSGAEQLFLTIVGDGEYGNEIGTIHRIIRETHIKFLERYNTSLKRVYLPYTKMPENAIIEEFGRVLRENGCSYDAYWCEKGTANRYDGYDASEHSLIRRLPRG